MKPVHLVLACMVVSLCFPCDDAGAKKKNSKGAFGISAGAGVTIITLGKDGNLWFVEDLGNRIGRITPEGVVTEFSAGITPDAGIDSITAGPDGDSNLWFTEANVNQIGRINANTGVVTEFVTGIQVSSGNVLAITAGPDGNLWFCETSNFIGRFNPTTGVVTEFSTGPSTGPPLPTLPFDITAGPDGAMWFTVLEGRIGRIDPTTGVVTQFSDGITGRPQGITSDGTNLWFTEIAPGLIGRFDPTTGVVTEFGAGIIDDAGPDIITVGPDGNLWFTESNLSNRIGRITPKGDITEFDTKLPFDAEILGIVQGPDDGKLWFTGTNGVPGSNADGIGWIKPGKGHGNHVFHHH